MAVKPNILRAASMGCGPDGGRIPAAREAEPGSFAWFAGPDMIGLVPDASSDPSAGRERPDN
ncbi:MAG: hypothetical protein WAT70_13225, partial [Rhizobiaceae bacterium]